MVTERATAAGPIRLNFRSVQQVVVEPEDENRFMMTAKEVSRACELVQNAKELREQFTQVLLYLWAWCEKRPELKAAYVYPGDGFLNVLVCTQGDHYHFDSDDAMTELDLDLVWQFDWLAAEVIQVPESAREGHVSLEKAILVYGDGSRPRTADGA